MVENDEKGRDFVMEKVDEGREVLAALP